MVWTVDTQLTCYHHAHYVLIHQWELHYVAFIKVSTTKQGNVNLENYIESHEYGQKVKSETEHCINKLNCGRYF